MTISKMKNKITRYKCLIMQNIQTTKLLKPIDLLAVTLEVRIKNTKIKDHRN